MALVTTPEKLCVPTVGGVLCRKFTVANLEEFLNALALIFVTPVPMVRLVRLVEEKNAFVPTLVTLLGMMTLGRLVQAWNVPDAILVTPLPIVRLVRPEHPKKAEAPILVTLFGSTRLVSPKQSLNA